MSWLMLDTSLFKRVTYRLLDSESEEDNEITNEQPRGKITRAPLALTPAPAIAPPTVIPPAATRPTVSPSSLTPPNHPRTNNQPVSDRKCLQQLLLHSRINSITGEIFLATLAFISGLARSLKPIILI